uniref:Uncharacterized protein n=1 Tax=viral metagenome TaxID=1070528 RepID=A0A6M3LKC5_9ZZZZ
MSDVKVLNHGTIFTIQPLSEQAEDWINTNVEIPDHMRMGNILCIDHHYIETIVNAMVTEGFEVI